VNAEDLVSIRTPEVVTEILEHMDGYYEESLEKPLKNLEDKLGDLPEAAKEEAKRAIALARSRVEEALRTRIQDLRRQVGESLRWFEPTEIQRALDRSELANGLE
jgi:F0F1-type ATP synthase membrane subunit b/b'